MERSPVTMREFICFAQTMATDMITSEINDMEASSISLEATTDLANIRDQAQDAVSDDLMTSIDNGEASRKIQEIGLSKDYYQHFCLLQSKLTDSYLEYRVASDKLSEFLSKFLSEFL